MADELKEKLAELAHGQWSGWMDYMFSKCIPYQPDTVQAEDGALIIPKWAADRWKRQAKTPYLDLPPAEMDSDRTEADKFLKVINARPDTGLVDALKEVRKAEIRKHKTIIELYDILDCSAEVKEAAEKLNTEGSAITKIIDKALAKYKGE